MERLTALSRGTQIMLAAGVLLLLDTFLAWQDFGDGGLGEIAESVGVDVSFNAWHGFWGWVMGLALIVLLAWLAARIAGVELSLPVSETLVAAALAALILVCAVIKNLADDESTIWSYAGVVLAVLVAVGAWLEVQDAGGVDTLRSEVSSMGSSGTATAPAPDMPSTTTTTPEPPAAETAPPAAPSPPAAPPQPPPSAPPPSEPDRG